MFSPGFMVGNNAVFQQIVMDVDTRFLRNCTDRMRLGGALTVIAGFLNGALLITDSEFASVLG